LWPLSRKGFPKQFLCLNGDTSLFQQTALRLTQLGSLDIAVAGPLLVTGIDFRFVAQEQLREAGIELGHALLEPSARNTAPALTLAALMAQVNGQDPVLVVSPADQTVSDDTAYIKALTQAVWEASSGNIVTLGIRPDRPESGYGYIEAEGAGEGVFNVKRFVEKPDVKTAISYLEVGGYFWNAGVFVLKASVWLNALAKLRPDIFQATCTSWDQRLNDGLFISPGIAAFKDIPAESIDYAVMEHATEAGLPLKMVPVNAGWSDLGSWDAVWSIQPKDKDGNTQVGDVMFQDSRKTLVHSTSRLVALVGVDDLIVIETPDAVLVVKQTHTQGVKQIVEMLSNKGRIEHLLHRKVHRPWGWYDNIDEGERFKVKRIQVKPGASISLQKHHYRAEHWIVVKGTAEITNGEKKLLLSENQSTYIPVGEIHRLTNPGKTPLEIIEVQSGSYLGEDDIVRYEDNYGRKD
jgi:mannose-1-phosphate guanylyltransferase/mannose-6-phosphate isomerase